MNAFEDTATDELTDELAINGNLGLAYAIQRVRNANHIAENNRRTITEQGETIRKLQQTIRDMGVKLDKASRWAIDAESRIKKLEQRQGLTMSAGAKQ